MVSLKFVNSSDKIQNIQAQQISWIKTNPLKSEYPIIKIKEDSIALNYYILNALIEYCNDLLLLLKNNPMTVG